MSPRVLVTYATRTGSAFEVAAAIGQTLARRGCMAEVRAVQTNPRLTGYQAVLMGSAVCTGQWLPEAVGYVKQHQQTLAGLPVAVFTVHSECLGDDPQSQCSRLAYLDTVRPFVRPVAEAYFAGNMAADPPEDRRDWDAIGEWAENLVVEGARICATTVHSAHSCR